MAAFDYTALDALGRKKKGVIEADSARQSRQLLRAQSLTPLSVQEASQGKSGASLFGRLRPQGMGARDVSLLTRQLATLVDSGLSVESALQSLSRQSEKPSMRSMLAAIRSHVVEGNSLAESLNQYPSSFSAMFRASVHAGERTGHLDKVLLHLADYTENAVAARQKILLALLYPAILTVVSLLIIVFLLAYIMPDMIRVFTGAGQHLPLLTRMLIFVSDGVQHYGLFALILIGAGVFFARRALARPEHRLAFDRQLLRFPGLGPVIRQYASARFASTLGMLHESGVPLVQAIAITSAVMGNLHLRARVGGLASDVSEGKGLAQAMETAAIFPPVLITLVASGEASGEMGPMLLRASLIQDRDLASRIAVILGLFEPMVLLVMGGIVLILVLAIILPILGLNHMVQ